MTTQNFALEILKRTLHVTQMQVHVGEAALSTPGMFLAPGEPETSPSFIQYISGIKKTISDRKAECLQLIEAIGILETQLSLSKITTDVNGTNTSSN